MKLISFLVPAYNSEAYLDRCLLSLVGFGEDVEIIVVDDGSKDSTGEIADRYALEHSNVQVIHQENGGHGAGINAGLKVATGLYFKVIDSDDWVDQESCAKLLELIKSFLKEEKVPDLILTEFVFECLADNTQYTMQYRKYFPMGRHFTWNEMKAMGPSKVLMMHALVYKRSILKECELNLPHHRFYEDNLYVYQPLFYVKSFYYFPVPLYRYLVGRGGQSVEKHTMAKRYMMQLDNMRELVKSYQYKQLKSLDKKHYKQMCHLLSNYSFLTLFFISQDYVKQKWKDYKAYVKEFKEFDKKLYHKIFYRTSFLITSILIPPLRRFAERVGYSIYYKMTHWG